MSQEPHGDAANNGLGANLDLSSGSSQSLPPVEPPSARLIAQLFLIPGLLVALLVGAVWFFFGWLAPGSYEPHDFLKGLRSNHDPVRWRTAQDLAQILPRKQELRLDVNFVQQLTALLQEELDRERSSPSKELTGDAPHLAEFLPAAVGHFYVPVAVPVLCRIIRDHVRRIEYLPGSADASTGRSVNASGLRVRNSLVALATLGDRLDELERLPPEQQHLVLSQLRDHAQRHDDQARNAQIALQYLEQRLAAVGDTDQAAQSTLAKPRPVLELVNQMRDALSLAITCEDEMSRKYACLVLANWPEPELEPLLLDLLRGDQPPTLLESPTPQRAIQEIQYNAALALLRRRSPRIPWRYIEELLDESALQARYRDDSPQGYNSAAVSMALLATLRTLQQVEHKQPGFLRTHPALMPLLEKLQSSSNSAVQVEARRLLGTESVSGQPTRRVSRELLLLIGVGLGVGILLLMAVFARVRRHSSPSPTPSQSPDLPPSA